MFVVNPVHNKLTFGVPTRINNYIFIAGMFTTAGRKTKKESYCSVLV